MTAADHDRMPFPAGPAQPPPDRAANRLGRTVREGAAWPAPAVRGLPGDRQQNADGFHCLSG